MFTRLVLGAGGVGATLCAGKAAANSVDVTALLSTNAAKRAFTATELEALREAVAAGVRSGELVEAAATARSLVKRGTASEYYAMQSDSHDAWRDTVGGVFDPNDWGCVCETFAVYGTP